MSTSAQAPALLTIRETAALLRLSEKTVRRRIRTGEIAAVRLGDGSTAPLRIPRKGLEEWLYGDPREAA